MNFQLTPNVFFLGSKDAIFTSERNKSRIRACNYDIFDFL